MATFAGEFNAGIAPFDGFEQGAGPLSVPPSGITAEKISDDNSGINTFVLPVVYPRSNSQGDFNTAFSYIFYNRIHLTPNPLNFGNILAPVSGQVEVWNAYFVGVTLNTVVLTGADGVSLIGGTAPQSFNALQARPYTFQAGTDGPPSVSGIATFTFAGGIVEILSFAGTRSLIFGFRADWTDPPVEEIEWLTEILPALSGKEQRIGLRTYPRRTVEMSYRLKTPEERAKFRAQIYGGASYQFSIALWSDASTLTAPAPLGSNTLQCDTVGRDFEANESALLYNSGLIESVTILSITPTQLTLQTVTGADWGANSYIVPIRRAFLSSEGALAAYKAITDQMDYATLRWSLLAGKAMPNRASSLSPTMYRGWPVLDRESSYNDDRSNELFHTIDELDNKIAPVRRFVIADRPVTTMDYQRVLRDRADIADFFAWLALWRGQFKSFWYPSFSPDFVLTQDVASIDTGIVVENYNYELFYNLTDNRRHIAIIPKSGPIICRRIESVVASAGNTETFLLDSAIGVDLTREQIRCVSILHPVRLASDLVRLNFETNTVAIVSLGFVELTTTD